MRYLQKTMRMIGALFAGASRTQAIAEPAAATAIVIQEESESRLYADVKGLGNMSAKEFCSYLTETMHEKQEPTAPVFHGDWGTANTETPKVYISEAEQFKAEGAL